MSDSLVLTDSPDIQQLEFLLCKRVAEDLHRVYPGHLWGVDISAGMLNVRNLALSGNWGFRVKLASMYSSSDFDKQIMRAGGELLEHYKQSRGRVCWDSINSLPVDFAGRHKPDL